LIFIGPVFSFTATPRHTGERLLGGPTRDRENRPSRQAAQTDRLSHGATASHELFLARLQPLRTLASSLASVS